MSNEIRSQEPTASELSALELYAVTHGRNWKQQLLDDWTNGRTEGELQVIRNTRGPTWLVQQVKIPRQKLLRAIS